MFSNYEHFSRAARDLFDAQITFGTTVFHAVMDAGVNATELNVDAVKTLLATATVATRQLLSAGTTKDWLTPVALHGNYGQLELAALPVSVRPPAVPDAGMAARTSLE